MDKLVSLLIHVILGGGGEDMMAMLWAQQIMLGKHTFDQVPRLLQDKVRELLEDSGMGEMAGA